MKKLFLAAAVAALSSTAFAGGSVGLGYQTNKAASQYGDCFNECYGDGDLAGFAVNASYDIANLFVAADYADLQDEADSYGPSGTQTHEQTRMALAVGYKHKLNDDSNVTAAIQYADLDWSFEYTRDNGVDKYLYEGSDSGVSLALGANTRVTDKVGTGATLSAGFETGIAAYVSVKLSDAVSLKTSYSRIAYELGDWSYRPYWNGYTVTSGSQLGDGDMKFNDEKFEISVNYGF